jgi:ACS family hexuronate transporter-like MFS transporter
VLAVFDVIAAIVVWMLVRDAGPRTPVETDAPAVAGIR